MKKKKKKKKKTRKKKKMFNIFILHNEKCVGKFYCNTKIDAKKSNTGILTIPLGYNEIDQQI